MIRFFFILAFLLVFLTEKQEPERFSWAEKSLTWADFQGKPNFRSPFAASSKTGISHNYALDPKGYLIKEESVVRSYFYPSLSWYKPEKTDESILAHEQNHFDISELHARILEWEIANFRFTKDSKTEIDKLYNSIEQRRRKMQANYDRETGHSRNKAAEKEWREKIKTLLSRYR